MHHFFLKLYPIWYEIWVIFLNSWRVSSQSHPWLPYFNIMPRDQDLQSSGWIAPWGVCCCFGYFGFCCFFNVVLVVLGFTVVFFSYPLQLDSNQWPYCFTVQLKSRLMWITESESTNISSFEDYSTLQYYTERWWGKIIISLIYY